MVYFDDNSRSLILTSKESPDGFFFGDKDDHFWEVMGAIIDNVNKNSKKMVLETISKKQKFCNKYHLALASLYENEDYSELITSLKRTNKNSATPIYIYCADTTSLDLYNKLFKKDLNLEATLLPSIPKNYSTISEEKKQPILDAYKKVLLQHIERNFEPIFSANSEILILGTMPSEVSQQNEFYYGNGGNRFWPALARIFNDDTIVKSSDKEKKDLNENRIKFCKKHKIALWDVIRKCTMIGGSDKSILEDADDFECNDIASLIKDSKIQYILCTGPSEKFYKRHCEKKTNIKAIKLPSPSRNNRQKDPKVFETYEKVFKEILK